MKFRQNFKYKEKKTDDDKIVYRYLKYQQVEWIFGKYDCAIIESSIHWNLIFFELKKANKNIMYHIIKHKKHIEILIEIVDVFDEEIQHILLALFHYSIKKINITKKDIIYDNMFLISYYWNGVHIDLVNSRIMKSPVYMDIVNIDSDLINSDDTYILNEYYLIIKNEYTTTYKEKIAI